MTRVGITTFHFSDNYGAALQSWALQDWFKRRGCNADFVPYHPEHVEEGGRIFLPTTISDIYKLAKIVYLKFSHFRIKYFGNHMQRARFESFRKNILGISGKSYRSREALSSARLNYDMVVCGSDQIWNPSQQFGVDPVYYGGFDTAGQTRRISYAGSFGGSAVPECWYKQIAINSSNLDAISVREPYGATLLHGLTGRSPVLVPDPVILNGEFDGLISRAENVGEIGGFCYALRSDSGIRELALAAAKRKTMTIFSPYNPHRRWREIGVTLQCGPCEWVSAVNNAQFVITNSFHGAVFSILMRKNFVVVGLPATKASLNDRALNLLESCGLMNRFVPAEEWERGLELLDEPIDWQRAEAYVSAAKATAEKWLDTQLAMAKDVKL